jgi:Flp pilus assembly protein TadG
MLNLRPVWRRPESPNYFLFQAGHSLAKSDLPRRLQPHANVSIVRPSAPGARASSVCLAGAAQGRLARAASIWDDRRGVSAIVLALSLPAIVGFAGLAVDAGLWYNDKRTIQGTVDLAAWTAAQTYEDEIATGTSVVTCYDGAADTTAVCDARKTAQAVASANGFANGSNGLTVTVNNPPASGPNKGVPGAFEVIIAKPESLFFSAQYLKTVTVSSRAVGLYQTITSGSGAPGCLLQLGNNSSDGIALSNGVQVSMPNCGVYANGTGSSAVSVIGGAKLVTDDISVVGGITQNNGGVITSSTSSSTPPPTEVKGASVAVNPYANVTLSSIETSTGTTITSTTCSSTSGTSFTTNNGSGKAIPVSPGVYCGGISTGNGVSIAMSPGVYYIVGGSFNLSSGTNTATGVTIVLVDANGSAPSVNIANGATFAISSPSSGATAGIAFYGDPTNTGAFNFQGGSTLTLNGAIDLPGSTFSWANGTTLSAASNCTQIIAANFQLAGGMNLNLNNCSSVGVKPIGGSKTTTTLAIVE